MATLRCFHIQQLSATDAQQTADSTRNPATANSTIIAAWSVKAVSSSPHHVEPTCQLGLHMSSAAGNASAPASIRVKRIVKGNTFPTSDGF